MAGAAAGAGGWYFRTARALTSHMDSREDRSYTLCSTQEVECNTMLYEFRSLGESHIPRHAGRQEAQD